MNPKSSSKKEKKVKGTSGKNKTAKEAFLKKIDTCMKIYDYKDEAKDVKGKNERLVAIKKAGELKVEIPMGISKSWNGLTISCSEKFISLKVSWPSWAELCGVLGWELRDVLLLELRDGLGFDPHFRGSFNFIYKLYYIYSVSLFKHGVLGFWGL